MASKSEFLDNKSHDVLSRLITMGNLTHISVSSKTTREAVGETAGYQRQKSRD